MFGSVDSSWTEPVLAGGACGDLEERNHSFTALARQAASIQPIDLPKVMKQVSGSAEDRANLLLSKTHGHFSKQ